MDDNDIDHSVIVSLDEHDDYTRDVVKAHPDKFSAVAVMNPAHPDPVHDLKARVAAMPIIGYRIWELGDDGAPVKDLRFFPLLEEMSDRGIVAWFYSSPDQMRMLPRVLEQLPDLKVVLNHLGFCQTEILTDEWARPRISTDIPPVTLPQVLSMAAYPQVAVHFSGHYAFSQEPFPYFDLKNISLDLLLAYGADRLLWASDWPWIAEMPGYAAVGDIVDLHLSSLSEAERGLVLGGNAARILGIGGA
jgi:predicted TIM-barrel fold metal-dependent hydrolase